MNRKKSTNRRKGKRTEEKGQIDKKYICNITLISQNYLANTVGKRSRE